MLKTFTKGGIHPPENKLSAHNSIQTLPLPPMVTIPLAQHFGAPARIIVQPGEDVKAGQLIARGDGFVSSNVHSSVSGRVLKTDDVMDAGGFKKQAIFIEVIGDCWIDSIIRHESLENTIELSGEEIIKKITEAGIVGLGGATFPAQVKMSIPADKKVEYVVINGVECEPYLTSDHRLMVEKGKEIMIGIQLIKKALHVKQALIGIENNKTDAIILMRELATSFKGIEICPLKVKYPQGGEKQLIKAILGREVPSGGLPMDVGTVVFNVGTVYAIYEAIQRNKPLFERIVTITGKSLSNPSNYRVRIGTPISFLIKTTGGLPEDTGKIVMGGPMMGKAILHTDVPIVKGTSGVVLFSKVESFRQTLSPCVRCAKCVSVCPMGLEPYLLMPLVVQQKYDMLEMEQVMICVECGSCAYTCPSGRPLLDYIRLGKSSVGKIIRSRIQ